MKLLSIFILITWALSGCVSDENTNLKTITQKIVFTSQLSKSEDATFPPELAPLCMPFMSSMNKEVMINPIKGTTFSRIDLSTPIEKKFELKTDFGYSIQDIFGAEDLSTLCQRVTETFNEIHVGLFSKKSDKDAIESITNYFKDNKGEVIFVYAPEAKNTNHINLNSIDYPLYHNIDSLRFAISNTVAQDKNNVSRILIIYNPNISNIKSPVDNQKGSEPQLATLDFDEIFNQYLEYKKQNHTPVELLNYLNNLRTTNAAVNSTILQDYRFVYEIGLTYAYMGVQNHDMCFSVLADAAEIAIANHKGKEMHQWINRDEEGALNKESHHGEFKLIHDGTENENASGLVGIKRISNLYQPHVGE